MSQNNRPSSGVGALAGLLNNGQLTWRLLNDDRVPTALKVVIPLLVALYFISPIDIIPDFIPVVGQLDDLGIVLLGMNIFINMSPKAVVSEHRRALGIEDTAPGASSDSATRRMDPNDAPAGFRPKVVDATYHEDSNTKRRSS